jgi:DNA polymerase III epsilon subunit family exonuclease
MFGRLQILTVAVLLSGTLFSAIPSSSTPVTNVTFVAFDTETTGFSPNQDRLVEIGAVKFRGNGEILAATNWIVNPGIPVPFYATEVHGITTEMTTNSPAFSEVWKAFVEFCGDSVLLAHNAVFDVGFLRAELDRAGIKPPHLPVGDTLPLFRAWFPHSSSHALGPLSAELGVAGGVYHRAEADSCHIIHVFGVGMKPRPQLQLKRLEREMGGFDWLDGKRN